VFFEGMTEDKRDTFRPQTFAVNPLRLTAVTGTPPTLIELVHVLEI
jgi:hypothetical protein